MKYIRENVELVKENMKRKNREDLDLVDKLLSSDEQKRKLMTEAQGLRAERNNINQDINKTKKEGGDIAPLLEKAKAIPARIKEIEEEQATLEKDIYDMWLKVPNLMHEDVPLGKDDSENVEEKTFGEKPKFDFEIKNHARLIEDLGMADFESSARVAGNGFYYIQGELALLNQALIQFAIRKMTEKGFLYVETPLMLREEYIDQVTDLADKEEQIYVTKDDNLALIGTSEHSLISRYAGTVVDTKKLPIMHTSYSMCFRKEIGAHGIDEKGLFRTHQFNKVEMIVICEPEESMDYYKKMQDITVEIFSELGIPGRVLKICSGDLGDLKHIMTDVEAWSPRRDAYIEVGSCSNLTEAQARKLKIKVDNGKERYVPHTLNNTAIATSRALVALIENFQNEDGSITIPEVLRPYMGGKERITKA